MFGGFDIVTVVGARRRPKIFMVVERFCVSYIWLDRRGSLLLVWGASRLPYDLNRFIIIYLFFSYP